MLSMQGQIEQQNNFKNKIFNNPINLINAVKEQTLNYQDTRYEMEIIDNSLTRFLLTKQKDKELHKCTKRFESSKQVLESHLCGPIKFMKYVSKIDIYDPADDMKNSRLYLEAWERFSAYECFKNANHKKYGNVLKHLGEQKGIRKDKFPKTIADAINSLNTYKTTHKESINKNKRNHIQQRNENQNQDIQELSKNMEMKYSFSTIERKCYICSIPSHKSPQCKLKNKIPKEKWAITKAKWTHVMEIDKPVEQKTQPSSISATESRQQGWASIHVVCN